MIASFLVCYDISDPKRLRKVASICEDYGYRRQYSVFLVRLSAVEFVRMKVRLYDVISHAEDQVLMIPICGRCIGTMETLGRPTDEPDAKDVVVVI